MLELEFLFNEINLLGILKQFHSKVYKIIRHSYNSISVVETNQIIDEVREVCQVGNYLLTSFYSGIIFWELRNERFINIHNIHNIVPRLSGEVVSIQSFNNLILILMKGTKNTYLKVFSLVKGSRTNTDYRCIQTIKFNGRQLDYPKILIFQNIIIVNAGRYITAYNFNKILIEIFFPISHINVYEIALYKNYLICLTEDAIKCFDIEKQVETSRVGCSNTYGRCRSFEMFNNALKVFNSSPYSIECYKIINGIIIPDTNNHINKTLFEFRTY
jgi:hypothetical protein